MSTELDIRPACSQATFGGGFDAVEDAASRVFREFSLVVEAPAMVFRQEGARSGYALVVPERKGERTLTVPAARESDFMTHGNPDTTMADLASFVVASVGESRADQVRLPLLSRSQAQGLLEAMQARLPTWHWGHGLSAVCPVVDRNRPGWRRRNSLWRAHASASEDGLLMEEPDRVPIREVKSLHTRIWGPNRSERFFELLDELARQGAARLFSVRFADGSLVAFKVAVPGERTWHDYYTATDSGRWSGIGNVALGWAWRNFIDHESKQFFSFGRGSERYKFQYANWVQEWYELRGFYSPVTER